MFSFILPNGNTIDMDGVIDAMEDVAGMTRYFLDTSSGNVGCVASTDRGKLDKLGRDPQYVEIPAVPAPVQLSWMADFIKTILKTGNKKEKAVYAELMAILASDAPETFDLCLKKMRIFDEYLLDVWAMWQDEHLFGEMKNWFLTLPVIVEEKFDGDCDCELCKLMEKGHHTLGDFNEASDKQKNKNNIFLNTEYIDDLYYEAMDAMNDGDAEVALEALQEALEMDSRNVQTHVGLASIYRKIGETAKYREHTLKGYDETRALFKKWPKKLSWHEMDNRQYHRAIFFRACLHIEEGETEKGLELYRQLLKMWPNDNLGVRYYAAAVYSGMDFSELDYVWDECNEKQNWNKLKKMLKEQNGKHHFWKEPKEQ